MTSPSAIGNVLSSTIGVDYGGTNRLTADVLTTGGLNLHAQAPRGQLVNVRRNG
jgi:hypothetical protein